MSSEILPEKVVANSREFFLPGECRVMQELACGTRLKCSTGFGSCSHTVDFRQTVRHRYVITIFKNSFISFFSLFCTGIKNSFTLFPVHFIVKYLCPCLVGGSIKTLSIDLLDQFAI